MALRAALLFASSDSTSRRLARALSPGGERILPLLRCASARASNSLICASRGSIGAVVGDASTASANASDPKSCARCASSVLDNTGLSLCSEWSGGDQFSAIIASPMLKIAIPINSAMRDFAPPAGAFSDCATPGRSARTVGAFSIASPRCTSRKCWSISKSHFQLAMSCGRSLLRNASS
jgi:hypothetical protein